MAERCDYVWEGWDSTHHECGLRPHPERVHKCGFCGLSCEVVDMPDESPVVRSSFNLTGEVKERPMAGVSRTIDGLGRAEPWEATALELALDLVPDLEAWIDIARVRGQSIDIAVTVDPKGARPPAGPTDVGEARRKAAERLRRG